MQPNVRLDYVKYVEEEAVYLYCPEGHKLEGEHRIKCRRDGTWSAPMGFCTGKDMIDECVVLSHTNILKGPIHKQDVPALFLRIFSICPEYFTKIQLSIKDLLRKIEKRIKRHFFWKCGVISPIMTVMSKS